MKAHIIIFFILLSFLHLNANNQISSSTQMQKMLVEEAINNIYDDFRANAFTCINVVKYGKGEISKQECEKRLPQTNKDCANLAKKHVIDFSNEKHAHNLMQILVTCPVAKMLGHEYEIKNGKPTYDMRTYQ